MQSSTPDYSREKLAEWQRAQTPVGVILAVGGGTYCSMRARIKYLARHLMSLQGESGSITLWINDARFEYGPVEMLLSPTPPSRQVTGVSIHLKKGGWTFVFELTGSEQSWFGLGNEPQPRQIEAVEEEEETAGVSL